MTLSDLILDDRYRLDERIAAGGVGQVWRARDLLLERPVAVKVLRPEYADHPEMLDRFRKEARHAGALSHPHVAQVYDYGAAGPGGSPYLVMEFVDGPSLADVLAADAVAPGYALDVIAQAADGLSAAHRAGLVHRDIKPGNILIGPEGQVKVTDFGIAHAVGQAPVTGPGLIMGTTQYMAPERIAGGPGTAASDLYALGIVLHECLTGVPPYDGSPADVMAAHLYLPLPPLPADAPPQLNDLVARLTAKDPAGRIGEARELALLAAQLRDSIAAGPIMPPARVTLHPGAGALVASPAAVAAGPASRLAGDDGPASLAGDSGRSGDGLTGTRVAQGDGTGGTDPAGPAEISAEWTVPPYQSRPASPAQEGQPPWYQRRRAGTLAVGAALLAGAGLVGLLVSGALHDAPAANRTPAGSSSAGVPARGMVPSPSASRASGASRAAGGTAGTSPAATSRAVSPQATHGTKTASASPSARPGTSGAASTGPAPSGSPSGTAGGTPGGSPSATPSGTPSAPASSPPPVVCVLGMCL